MTHTFRAILFNVLPVNIDPVDDCTFYYINQYYATTSDADWLTRFGSFRIDGCADADPLSESQPDLLATKRKQWQEQQRQRRRDWWAWMMGEQKKI
jgi:hypothetical protein